MVVGGDASCHTTADMKAMSLHTRRFVVWMFAAVCCLTAVGVLAVVNATSLGSHATNDRILRLSKEVRCPTCNGLSVADSDSALAVAARNHIAERVRAGDSDATIRTYFVDRYGKDAVLMPTARGITSVLWYAPLVVAVGVGVVFLFWLRRRRVAAVGDDDAFDERQGETFDELRVASQKQVRPSDRSSTAATFGVVAVLAVAVLAVWFVTTRAHQEPNSAARVERQLLLAQREANEGRALDALKTYDDLLKSHPEHAAAWANRGWLLQEAGLGDQALQSFDRALALNPTLADAYFYKGMTLLRHKHDNAGARVALTKYLQLVPDSESAKMVQKIRDELPS